VAVAVAALLLPCWPARPRLVLRAAAARVSCAASAAVVPAAWALVAARPLARRRAQPALARATHASFVRPTAIAPGSRGRRVSRLPTAWARSRAACRRRRLPQQTRARAA